MDMANFVGPIVTAGDYNQDILMNLRKLFRQFKVVNAVSVEIDQLLIENQSVDIARLKTLQRESIESLIREGHCEAGFALGKLFSIESFGSFNIALQSSPNLSSAIRLLSLYTPQLEAILKIRLCETSGTLFIDFQQQEQTQPWQYEDALVACWQLLLQLTGAPLKAQRVSIQAPESGNRLELTTVFSVDINFDAKQTYIQLSAEDWARPTGAPSPLITSLFQSWTEQDDQSSNQFLSDIYRSIYQLLSLRDQQLTLPNIANQHHCSVATMKRRLAKHNKTLTQMKDEVSMLVCYHYVTMTVLPFSSVAEWLSFSDGANLCRACKRWFGMSPSKLRKLSSM
ncbi:AraC family transcriptional regulator [Vibrio sp. 10N]|uniref:AraC family transcriptional regulator n=1 Tax=Vibrio sp. 10N TaxID=3058938 RepID=UPI0028149539|nr:AraC family transcriptional regulator [Vibrio sp. 10N]